MAASLNKAILIGNLGHDPEIRTVRAGVKMATFSLATSESWRDRDSGERREVTDWHRIVVFQERLVELAEKHLRKGSKIWLEGKIKTRTWKDKKDVEQRTTEIVLQGFGCDIQMLDRREQAPAPDPDAYGVPQEARRTGGPTGTKNDPNTPRSFPAQQEARSAPIDLNDEVPF